MHPPVKAQLALTRARLPGENIADNGGVKNAYNAYLSFIQNVKGGRHRELLRRLRRHTVQENLPLFFVSYGQGWCAIQTDAFLKLLVQTDVHSPPKQRVIGPLMNFPPFSATFGCPVGSVMNPTHKCTVW